MINQRMHSPNEKRFSIVMLLGVLVCLGGISCNSNQNGAASENQEEQDSASKKYPPEVPGVAQIMGLQYFPPQLNNLIFLNLEKQNTAKHLGTLNQEVKQDLQLIQDIVGLQPSEYVSLTRGWIQYFDDIQVKTQHFPSLYVLRTKIEIDRNHLDGREEVQKDVIAGKDVYSHRGLFFAFPDSTTIVLGNRNEVLYAMRFAQAHKNFASFSWIDCRKYDSIQIYTLQSNGQEHDRIFTAASGNTLTVFDVCNSEKEAKVLADMTRQRIALMEGRISVRQFVDHMQDIAAKMGKPYSADWRKRKIEELSRELEQMQANYRRDKQINDYHFERDGWVMINQQKFRSTSAEAMCGHFGQAIHWKDHFHVKRDFSQDDSSRNKARQSLEKFETYQFNGKEDRNTLEHQVANMDLLELGVLGGHPEPFELIDFCINHTSSHKSRQIVLERLCKIPSEWTIQIIGTQANYFDLVDALTTRGEFDDIHEIALNHLPDTLAKPYRDRKNLQSMQELPDHLVAQCNYYLATAGDPITTLAACRIAEDLRLEQSVSLLQLLANNSQQTEDVRSAAQRAIKTIADPGSIARNDVIDVEDAEQALIWLKNTYRPQRASAIQWVMQNPLPSETREQYIEALIQLLDDSLFYEIALEALKKQMTVEDSKALQEIVSNATTPRQSDFRQRQDHTLYRVVELMAHLKDGRGLSLAAFLPDSKVRSYAVEEIIKNEIDVTPLVDAIIAALDKGQTRNRRMTILGAVQLSEESKAKVREWANRYFESGKYDSDLWTAIKNADPFRKEMVPLLITIWSENGNAAPTIAEYLMHYGPSIEPMVLAAIEKKNETRFKIWFNVLCPLLNEIGTVESIPVLESYLNEESETARDKVRQTIDNIKNADRQRSSFESFPDPGPPKKTD